MHGTTRLLVQLGCTTKSQTALGMTPEVHGDAMRKASTESRHPHRSGKKLAEFIRHACRVRAGIARHQCRQMVPDVMRTASGRHNDHVEWS